MDLDLWDCLGWVEDGLYYDVPSVCPSVKFSCPLHNSDTVQDIFMKIGTNINALSDNVQRIRPVIPSTFFMACPLSIHLSVHPSVNFLCPLHNSDTVQDIFMKLGTNINHHQTMCREQEPQLHLYFLPNYGPLNFF